MSTSIKLLLNNYIAFDLMKYFNIVLSGHEAARCVILIYVLYIYKFIVVYIGLYCARITEFLKKIRLEADQLEFTYTLRIVIIK